MDPGLPGGEGRARKPSRPPPVLLTSGLAKARLCGELASRPPSACDSAGPPEGEVTAAPVEGRTWLFLGRCRRHGKLGLRGCVPACGRQQLGGEGSVRGAGQKQDGGALPLGPEGGSRNPGPASGPVGFDPSTGLVRSICGAQAPNTPNRPSVSFSKWVPHPLPGGELRRSAPARSDPCTASPVLTG